MNPQTIGPYNSTSTPALVAGTPIAVGTDVAAVAIQVHNDSPYRVYVQFDGPRPQATVAAIGSYQGIAGPWSHPVIMVRPQYSDTYRGTLWLMPVDISSNLALVGTVSSIAEIHVDVFGPGDDLPQSWAMPRQQDASSQQRVIAVPPAGGSLLNGTWQTATFPTLGINIFSLTATNIALQSANLYIFHLGMYPQVPAVGAPVQVRCSMQAQFQTSGFANVGSPTTIYLFPMIAYLSTTQFAVTNFTITPFFPLAINLTVPATAANLAINLVKNGGGDLAVQFNYQMWVDPNNAGPPASYGGNNSPQRWAGQYSSVAGLW